MDPNILIGLMVVALVDASKDLSPKIKGWVTVLVAIVIGGLIGAVDQSIGLTNITIAQGVVDGLAAAGSVGVAKRIG